jgi:DNA-directed RNA polymerase specialized sigma24 family protein
MTSGIVSTQTRETSKPTPPNSPTRPAEQRLRGAIQDPEGGAEQGSNSPLIDNPIVSAALRRMILRMEKDFHAREDLLQEALVHLWLAEQQRPGQRVGWYLRSAKLHLQHVINRGRSVDSPKHRAAMMALTAVFEGSDDGLESTELDEGFMPEVNARDILSLMAERLGKMDRSILYGLADGLGPREIAKGVQVSHVSVVQHRRKIASVAIKLGVEPPLPGRSQRDS